MGGSLPLLLAAEQVAAPVPASYGWALVKMLLVLVAVCALAYVALRYGLRRLLPGGAPRGRHVKVLDRCGLAPGHTLWIVEVGGRVLLLAGAERGISLITELDAADLGLAAPSGGGEVA